MVSRFLAIFDQHIEAFEPCYWTLDLLFYGTGCDQTGLQKIFAGATAFPNRYFSSAANSYSSLFYHLNFILDMFFRKVDNGLTSCKMP